MDQDHGHRCTGVQVVKDALSSHAAWVGARYAHECAFVSRSAAALAIAVILTAGRVYAQDATRSTYTTIDLKACKVLKKGADGAAWLCRGMADYPVYVATGDERFFVSAGPAPQKRRAAQQTLKAFNSLFPAAATRATIEWRVQGKGKHAVPYATILRYYTARDGAKGQVLVVSKVAADQSCQVAMIDAMANADAIERARKIADETALQFDCSTDPKVDGATGKSPM